MSASTNEMPKPTATATKASTRCSMVSAQMSSTWLLIQAQSMSGLPFIEMSRSSQGAGDLLHGEHAKRSARAIDDDTSDDVSGEHQGQGIAERSPWPQQCLRGI